MAQVLLIEDDPSIRFALTVALGHDGHCVVAREHGHDLCAADGRDLANVDLAIVDVALPQGPDGIHLARTLSWYHRIPVIILTAQGDLETKGAGYCAGADLYVTKPFSVNELMWQIAALLRRTTTKHELLPAGELIVDPFQRVARHRASELPLTPTEFDLLAALVRHQGQVLSKMRLLEIVWGHDAYDINVVETTIRRLRMKLGSEAAHLVETIRGAGYRLRG